MTIRTICFPYLFLSVFSYPAGNRKTGLTPRIRFPNQLKYGIIWQIQRKKRAFASSDSILLPGCPKLYDWNDEDLSEQGRWIRDWFLSETD